MVAVFEVVRKVFAYAVYRPSREVSRCINSGAHGVYDRWLFACLQGQTR
jgi:hypothetical protein